MLGSSSCPKINSFQFDYFLKVLINSSGSVLSKSGECIYLCIKSILNLIILISSFVIEKKLSDKRCFGLSVKCFSIIWAPAETAIEGISVPGV